MFGLKIFVRVKTFRQGPPVPPHNFCYPVIHCSVLYCLKLAILKMAEIKERPLIWFCCPWLMAILFFWCIPACYLGLSLSLYSSCPQLDQLKTFLKASQACLTRWVTFSGSRGTSPTCQGQSSGGLKIPFSGRPPHLPTSPPLRIRQFGDINPFQGRQGEEETTISIALSFFFNYFFALF